MQPSPPPVPPREHRAGSGARRVVAGVGAVALAIVAAIVGVYALIVALVATRVPDAYDDGGDLSDPPESWGEAALAVGLAGTATLLMFTAVALAVVLAFVASGRRPPRARTPALIAFAPAAILVALLGLLLASNSGNARLAVDCDDFRFDRAAFLSPDAARWEPQAIGLQDCESVLYEQSRARVQELLGAPDRQVLDGQLWSYKGHRLTVRFSGDAGVERVRYRPED